MDWKKVGLFWSVFYLILSVIYWLKNINTYHFTIALIFTIIFLVMVMYRIKIPAISVFFLGLSLLWNSLGNLRLLNGSSLYALQNYDLFVHFTGFLFFTLGIITIYFKDYKKQKWVNIVMILFFLLGLGATIEISEYVGFRVLGYGSSWLQFGDGDDGDDFGPWEDSMEDMIANLLGIISGILIFYTYKGVRYDV